MTHDYDPNTDPNVPPRDAPPRGGRAKTIPPLLWIILGLLVLIVVLAVSQCDGVRTSPSGDGIHQADDEDPAEAIMPAAPPPVTNTLPATNAPAP